MEFEYKNYGDVNPLEYGGIWVRKNTETEFDIVRYDPEDRIFANLLVNIFDSWIDRISVMNFIGMTEETFDSIWFAIGCIDYYVYENFGFTYEIKRDELLSILKARGIEI